MNEAETALSEAEATITNADRERKEAVKQKKEYQRLCNEQKMEIEKAALKKMEAYKSSISQVYRKRELKLQEQFKRKIAWYHLALAELGIYSLVMTIMYFA